MAVTEPLPIACILTPDLVRARREGLLADLLRSSDSREVVAEGIRFRFPPTTGTLSAQPRNRCGASLLPVSGCTITVKPDGGPFTFELTGPPGTKEFLEELLTA